MDVDKAFENISENIKNENFSAVRPEVDNIIGACPGDTDIMLKCASLLKAIDDDEGCQSIIDKVMDSLPDDPELMYNIGISVRSLGRFEDAYELMVDFKDDQSKMSEVARTMMMNDECEEALAIMEKKNDKTIEDRLLLCDILCSLGEFSRALEDAESIVKDDGESYRSLVNQCSVLIRMGRTKDAVKLAKSHLKEDKKNADSLALGAYVMWINDKIPAAANYANRALHIDYTHVGALEVMAMCLIEKKKFSHAKLLAGVINEKEPGSPAVMRILDACRMASNA